MALALGKTVGELSEELSDAEFQEWMSFYRMEPFGEDRADLRAGIIAATIVNVQRGKKGRPVKPTDFMPYQKAGEQRRRMSDGPDPKKLDKQVRGVFGSMMEKQKKKGKSSD